MSALRACLPSSTKSSFVDENMAITMTQTLVRGQVLLLRRRSRCLEQSDEPATVRDEQVLKLECNISVSTNFMVSGILDVNIAAETESLRAEFRSGSREIQSESRSSSFIFSVSDIG